MASRTLVDLDISVTRSPSGYTATLRAPDGRRVQTAFQAPFEEYQLKYYIAEATRGPQPARRSSRQSADALAQEIGRALFAAMFSGAALHQLDATLDAHALTSEQGVRLRLDLSGAPELSSLPWEFLYHPERRFFLALSPDLTVVRYLQTPEPVRTLQVEPPLRILAMACSPRDLEPLDVARERAGLEASLERLIAARMVEIDWAPANTLHAVTTLLAQRDYHIFHFMGHGAYLEEPEGSKAGYLLFESDDGTATPVGAARLGQAFRRTVRLALINACEGAVGDLNNPSAGVATSLLAQGTPAVVAMQFSISDVVAIPFASEFYSAIAVGLPVDAAMTSARRHVWARFEDSGEWATPVLYLRAPDGVLFDLKPTTGDAHTQALRQEVVASTMGNLDVDLVQLRAILSSGAGEVIRRLPDWLKDRWQSADRTAEELYQQAVEHMRAERWADANRCFKLCNDRSPGYRDIMVLWQQSKLQERLADHYRRLVSAYAEQKWRQVLELARAILAEAPSYKDAPAMYNHALRAVGAPPRPPALPPDPTSQAQPPHLPPARPPTLPGGAEKPETGRNSGQERPPSLPRGS